MRYKTVCDGTVYTFVELFLGVVFGVYVIRQEFEEV